MLYLIDDWDLKTGMNMLQEEGEHCGWMDGTLMKISCFRLLNNI